MSDYLYWIEFVPFVGMVLVLWIWNGIIDKKFTNARHVLYNQGDLHRELLEKKIDCLDKKIDELRLQVGIINHGSRVIHMPTLAADIVERRKPGPKPGSRKKPKEIE